MSLYPTQDIEDISARITAVAGLRGSHRPGKPGRCICDRPLPCPVIAGCDRELQRLHGQQQLPFADTVVLPAVRNTQPAPAPRTKHRRRARFKLSSRLGRR